MGPRDAFDLRVTPVLGERLPSGVAGARFDRVPDGGSLATFAAVEGFGEGVWWVDETTMPTPGSVDRGEGEPRVFVVRRSVRGPDEPVDAGRAVMSRVLVANGDGSVSLRRIEDHAEERELVFEPPLLVLPPGIERGERPLGEARVVVKDPATGEVLAEGKAASLGEYHGWTEVVDPSGRGVDAREFSSKIVMTIRGVEVTRVSTRWYTMNGEVLASEERVDTRVLFVDVPSVAKGLRRVESGRVRGGGE